MLGPDLTFSKEPEVGLIPRAFRYLYSRDPDAVLICSYYEIYNERVFDLLSDQLPELQIGAQLNGSRTEVEIRSADSGIECLARGCMNRSVMGERRSTRSHALFTISRVVSPVHVATLSFLDLAGCERVSKSNADETTSKEAVCIGQSLSALHQCLTVSPGAHCPYRNSKLTFLLQHIHRVQVQVAVICVVSLLQENAYESICTLQFAKRLCSHSGINSHFSAEETAKIAHGVGDSA